MDGDVRNDGVTCVWIRPVSISAPSVIMAEPIRKRVTARMIAWMGTRVGDSLNCAERMKDMLEREELSPGGPSIAFLLSVDSKALRRHRPSSI